MLAMENAPRYSRPAQPHSSFKHRRSGYEPSDTESELQESPWHEGPMVANRPKTPPNAARTISPLDRSRKPTSTGEYENSAVKASRSCPTTRRHSRSPYKPVRDDDDHLSPIARSDQRRNTSPTTRRHSRSPYKPVRDGDDHLSPIARSDLRRNTSPFKAQEHRRHVSPYNSKRDDNGNHRHVSPYKDKRDELNHGSNELNSSFRRRNQRTPPRVQSSVEHSYFPEISRVSERSNHSRHRSVSAPKPRAREEGRLVGSGHGGGRSPSSLANTVKHKDRDGASYTRDPPSTEINEVIANTKLSETPSSDALLMESTESISHGDIFFSRDCTAMQKDSATKNSNIGMAVRKDSGIKNGNRGNNSAPQLKVVPERNTVVRQASRGSSSYSQNQQAVSISSLLSQTNTSSNSTVSRLSNSKFYDNSKLSNGCDKSSGSLRKFTANRQRSQTEAWFSCVRAPSCRKSRSPDSRAIDEAGFIEKAFVVEELRMFWADKHRPRSLSEFICHKQQAQLLKQLVSNNNCPHILFKGPAGSGKKSLSMALLHEIFGDSSLRVSHELRHFHVQESGPIKVVVPLASSPHHVELNLKSESKNVTYALMALVKEIADNHALTTEVSEASFKAHYKVIVLNDVDKAAENVQHLIKWVMDCYSDVCKIILCCEDDTYILDSIKSRCKLVTVDAPITPEIMEVLIQIAKKENFELSIKFAAKIATKSKPNMRRAIMALEACKAHNYPFIEEQPVPLGWEEVLVELAAEVLADPSPKRLFLVRGKFQKLLVEFVHPKLILQKLVEQFLKGIEASLKRELYYWHAYYDKRLPTGTSALLKLEEFVAKFMSIQRKSFSIPPYA